MKTLEIELQSLDFTKKFLKNKISKKSILGYMLCGILVWQNIAFMYDVYSTEKHSHEDTPNFTQSQMYYRSIRDVYIKDDNIINGLEKDKSTTDYLKVYHDYIKLTTIPTGIASISSKEAYFGIMMDKNFPQYLKDEMKDNYEDTNYGIHESIKNNEKNTPFFLNFLSNYLISRQNKWILNWNKHTNAEMDYQNQHIEEYQKLWNKKDDNSNKLVNELNEKAKYYADNKVKND